MVFRLPLGFKDLRTPAPSVEAAGVGVSHAAVLRVLEADPLPQQSTPLVLPRPLAVGLPGLLSLYVWAQARS